MKVITLHEVPDPEDWSRYPNYPFFYILVIVVTWRLGNTNFILGTVEVVFLILFCLKYFRNFPVFHNSIPHRPPVTLSLPFLCVDSIIKRNKDSFRKCVSFLFRNLAIPFFESSTLNRGKKTLGSSKDGMLRYKIFSLSKRLVLLRSSSHQCFYSWSYSRFSNLTWFESGLLQLRDSRSKWSMRFYSKMSFSSWEV